MEEKKLKNISPSKAMSRMAAQCARREYAAFDIETKLQRYNLDSSTIEEIIAQLKKDKFIDETRFTRSFIKDKLQFNKWGRKKIEYALKQKRIPNNIVNKVFEEFTDQDLNGALLDIMQAKWKTIKGDTNYERRTKLIRFALSRGFDMDNIMKQIDKIE